MFDVNKGINVGVKAQQMLTIDFSKAFEPPPSQQAVIFAMLLTKYASIQRHISFSIATLLFLSNSTLNAYDTKPNIFSTQLTLNLHIKLHTSENHFVFLHF
jgi:hypothetical protein